MSNTAQHGFSLIETMVVVAIIGILTIPGIATYNRMNDRAQAQQAANRIASVLKAAQKDADAGAGAKLCHDDENKPTQYRGVTLTFAFDTDTYSEEVECGGAGDGSDIKSGADLGVPAAVTVTAIDPITFNVLSQGITTAANPYQITVSRGSIQYQVDVTRAGGISVTP